MALEGPNMNGIETPEQPPVVCTVNKSLVVESLGDKDPEKERVCGEQVLPPTEPPP